MQAIVTKFLGPTNYRGSRIRATCQARSTVIAWDYALGVDDNHRAAAMALVCIMGWGGLWVGGANPNGKGSTYVNAERTFGSSFRAEEQAGAEGSPKVVRCTPMEEP